MTDRKDREKQRDECDDHGWKKIDESEQGTEGKERKRTEKR